jgi:hypothetical protein
MSAPERSADRARDAPGVPTTLVALVVAVLLVIAAIVAVALSDSAVVRAAAVGVFGVAGLALAAYLLAVLNRTGVSVERAGAPGAPTMDLGAGVDGDRLREALVTVLRDAHALQRGTRHIAGTAAAMIRSPSDSTSAATAVIDLLQTQRDRAAGHEQRLEERLRALGTHPSRGTDDEAIIAASLYERLLVRGVATNARHAFGLTSLGAATYILIEHLAAVAGDDRAPGRVAARSAATARSAGGSAPPHSAWPAYGPAHEDGGSLAGKLSRSASSSSSSSCCRLRPAASRRAAASASGVELNLPAI